MKLYHGSTVVVKQPNIRIGRKNTDFGKGFYMGTDIGYCRFIFYFGLVGFFSFAFFLTSIARECALLLPKYKLLISFILMLGFVIWLKVATDIFLVLALFLCIGNMQEQAPRLEEEV